jgi:hypothetical protein
MSSFELSFAGEDMSNVLGNAGSPEGLFYFLHAEHFLYLMSD